MSAIKANYNRNMSAENVPFLHVELGAGGAILHGIPAQRLGQVDLPEPLQTNQDVFAEWQWDGTRVVIRNCRLGFSPLFYYATDKEFGVAPTVDRLLECGAPSELDDTALAVFLRLGFHVGEDTVFRAIRAVPPGGEVCWSGGKPRVKGEYSIPQQQNISRQAAIDGYGELFRQAVQRRVPDGVRFGLPLSGGRDSRHILLELNALGYRPDACYSTHDYPPFREENIRFAGLLCEQLNIPQHVFGQPGSRVAAEVRKNRVTSYGAMEHTWAMAFYRNIARHTPVIYDGLAGDVLSAGYQLRREHADLFEQGRLEELSECLFDNWLAQPGYEDALMRILSGEAARRFSRDRAVKRVTRELARHTSAANPLSSFYFWNRTRRGVSLIPFSILPDAGITAVTPFLDHDLFDFLASLPTEMFIDRTFHTETIRHMHPGFKNIPYAENSEPIKENNRHYRRFLAEAGAYLAFRGDGSLIKRGPTIRRLLALALLNGGNLRMRMSWIAPFAALYMTQLERAAHDSIR
jgi:asparagine synthetase B (glutamine-hydrolysing)